MSHKRPHIDPMSPNDTLSKKIKTSNKVETNFNLIPKYLLKSNPSFTLMIEKQPWLKTNIEDLRAIAILMHQIAVLNLQNEIMADLFQIGYW